MLEKLRTLNPEIEIFSVNDKEFLKSITDGTLILPEKDKIIDIEFLSNEYIFQFFKTATLFYIDGKEVRANPNTVIIHNRNHPRKFKTLDFEMQNDYVCFYTDDSDLEGIPFSTPISVTDTEFAEKLQQKFGEELDDN